MSVGTYLNPGNQSFTEAVNSQIYVDKTGVIDYINSLVSTGQKYVSVSRPRRFGKSMAANMLCAYYDRSANSRDLFAHRRLGSFQQWDHYLGQFDVIRIVMTDFFVRGQSVEVSLDRLQKLVCRDILRAYPEVDYYDDTDLPQTMADAYADHRRQFIVVIDEWDCIFRMQPDDQEGQTRYLDFLRCWLKDKDYIALTYMTGILPIKKYGEHSALNMFTEYSMVSPMQFAEYTGFTSEEVKALCTMYHMDYSEVEHWYNGYQVHDWLPVGQREPGRKGSRKDHVYSIYSPLSVVSAMLMGEIQNYWNRTETYEALAEYIRMDYDGLKRSVALLMDGGRIKVDTSHYQNDMTTFHNRDDILTLLTHLGYLGYDACTGEVYIPNQEIRDVFKTSTASAEWVEVFASLSQSQELLKATWNKDGEKVAELVEKAHDRVGNQVYHSEAGLSYGIQLAYYAAQKYYTTILELDSGKGYADIVYLPAPQFPNLPALLIELKYNHDADTALGQIKRQRYPDRLEHYRGNLLLVGINYNKEIASNQPGFKHHSCVIESA